MRGAPVVDLCLGVPVTVTNHRDPFLGYVPNDVRRVSLSMIGIV